MSWVRAVIVKLGNWSNNPSVKRVCDRLLAIEGTSSKATPQRFVIKRNRDTMASVGLEAGVIIMEFRPAKGKYAEAHSSSFVKTHPLAQMAKEGWLMANTKSDEETDKVISWILSSIN